MEKKAIHLNEKFVDGETVYTVEQYQDIYNIYTCVYDKWGEYLFSTEDVGDFTKFYRLGWTKAEVHAGIKKSWVIVKDRQEHIWDLHSRLPYCEMENWLNLSTWENLPTEDAFTDWLEDDFEPIWDELEDGDGERDFDEDNARLVESVERLDALMENDDELVQLTD